MLGGGEPTELTERILGRFAAVASIVVLVNVLLEVVIGLGAIPSCISVVKPENLAALITGCS
jgi:hypothetical protein